MPRAAVLAIPFAWAAAGAAGDPEFKIIPAITVQEIFSTNSQLSGNNAQFDAISEVIPELRILGETARTNLFFDYAPTYEHYDLGTSPDQFNQNLFVNGTYWPWLNHLSIDFSANASETSSGGNLGNAPSGVIIPAAERVLYYSGTIAPHFHERFESYATLDAYYRLTSGNSSQEGTITPGSGLQSQSLLQRDAELVIGSGDTFGRLTATLNLDHLDGSGSGADNNTHNDTDYLQLEYHLSHKYSLLGSIGYQKILYDSSGSTAGYVNEGMTWNAGFRATPSERSTLTATYGRQNGGYAPSLSMSYQLGGRSSISAQYNVTIQNQLQSTFQNQQYLSHDAFGNPVDSRTGLPFTGPNQTFGAQNALFRDKTGLVAVTHQFLRSQLTITATYESRYTVSGLASTDEAIGGNIIYSREMTPVLQGSAYAGYTDHRSTGAFNLGGDHVDVVNAGVSLTYAFNATLTANVSETYFQRTTNDPSLAATTNQFIIGLRKEF